MRRDLFLRSFIVVLILITVVTATASAGAPPAIPAFFYGTVHTNGGQAPAGATVRALIDGVEHARDTVHHDAQLGAVYSCNIPADDPDTPEIEGGRDGDTVIFFLDVPGEGSQQMMQRAVWHTGGVKLLNLSSYATVTLPLVIRLN